MAEYLLKDLLEESGMADWEVASAGVAALQNSHPSEQAVKVMQEKNIDLTTHRARKVSPKILARAELILTMTKRHRLFLKEMLPGAADKIFTLKEYLAKEEKDVIDPFGSSDDYYRMTRDELEKLLVELVEKLG